MEAGPRDRARQVARGAHDPRGGPGAEPLGGPLAGAPGAADPAGLGHAEPLDDDRLLAEPGQRDRLDGEPLADPPLTDSDEQSFRDLRPPSRLRLWQLIPIVALGALGSLMFAFPLAFEFGDGGPVVAMLGLLLSCCAAGWALMAARRVGYTWPGLPARGSGGRPDWRFAAGYLCLAVIVALLAVWRVARLH